MPTDPAQFRAALANVFASDDAASRHTARELFHPDIQAFVSSPVEDLHGQDALYAGFVAPVRAALRHVHRRDEIFIVGTNRRETGGTWISTFTHYVGTFGAPLWGIQPSNQLVFLRAGEFYRIDGANIVEARIIVDLPDLMRQAKRDPFGGQLGTEMLFPGPATHDGILPLTGDGSTSLDLVEAMLSDLHVYDPETGTSRNQTGTTGYWAEDMLWYGPGGIGSNYRWDGFVKDHRKPFLTAFPDRKGGNHYCRIGQGDYAAVSGWPSMTMTQAAPYLGAGQAGQKLTLRVMDFYRCANGRIAENWVFLDYIDLFQQMGINLINRSNGLT